MHAEDRYRHRLDRLLGIAWIVFWVYWLASAFGVKEGRAGGRRVPLNDLSALSVLQELLGLPPLNAQVEGYTLVCKL